MGTGKKDVDSDWEKRTLCSDGSCIGVIGADGRCKECGKPYEGDLPEADGFGESFSDEAEDSTEDLEFESESPMEDSADSVRDPDPDWENRRLCSDGNCIGVIGADGRCKECGKPSEE